MALQAQHPTAAQLQDAATVQSGQVRLPLPRNLRSLQGLACFGTHCGTVSLCGCACAIEGQAEWQPLAPEACELTKTEPGAPLEEDLLSLEGISMEQVLQNGTPLLASGGQVRLLFSPHVTCSVIAQTCMTGCLMVSATPVSAGSLP